MKTDRSTFVRQWVEQEYTMITANTLGNDVLTMIECIVRGLDAYDKQNRIMLERNDNATR